MKNTFLMRRRMVETLRNKAEIMDRKLGAKPEVELKAKKGAASEPRVEERLEEDLFAVYSLWNTEQASLNKDAMEIKRAEDEALAAAIKQHEADSDASLRAKGAIAALKEFIVKLLKKVPVCESACRRSSYSDGLDPLEEGDMRTVMANLNERYRNGDNIQVLTTLLATMQTSQGSSSIEEYVRSLEDVKLQLARLKVTSMTISDFFAMVALNGMTKVTRESYLKQEASLNLTMLSLGEARLDEW